jgi:hypothetical protein
MPQGAFVHVKYSLTPAWGDCTSTVSVKNVPSWGGEKNPVSGSSQLYFAGTDGQVDHPDAPFSVTQVPLGCPIGGMGCGGLTDDYARVQRRPRDPGPRSAGRSASVSAPMPMTVHNLRSFESGACDDY